MKTVLIRADASIEMGSGHIMRCLTLAEKLKLNGFEVTFMCRKHNGNLIDYLVKVGYRVIVLSENKSSNKFKTYALAHAAWLGVTQQKDSEEAKALLAGQKFDWMVVDHYALDQEWQQMMLGFYEKLLVIDDLGDRHHLADLLIDQNLGSSEDKYRGLVKSDCKVLAGPQFALLREEFSQWRKQSLENRQGNKLGRMMISFGGVDKDNYTGQVLAELSNIDFVKNVEVDVIMGATAPHLEMVSKQAEKMPGCCKVFKNVQNMAERLSQTDLVIGASGSSSWERCCLGVPTLMFVLANNQAPLAEALQAANAAKKVEAIQDLQEMLSEPQSWLNTLSKNAANICDGQGTDRVLQQMKAFDL